MVRVLWAEGRLVWVYSVLSWFRWHQAHSWVGCRCSYAFADYL